MCHLLNWLFTLARLNEKIAEVPCYGGTAAKISFLCHLLNWHSKRA